MPLVKSLLETGGPQEPHLALQMEDGWVGLPPGARFLIVTQPGRADRAIPVFLAKVTRDTIHFRCNCGQPECTRVLVYKVTARGYHPEATRRRAVAEEA